MVMKRNQALRWVCPFEAGRVSRSMAVRLLRAAMGFMVLLLWASTPVMANEAVSQEEPTATSVEESVSSIERSFTEKMARPGLFPRLKEELKDADPFFRDTKLDINLRTFYFYRDNYPNTIPQTNEACNPFVDAGLRPWSSALDASLRGAAPRRKKLDSFSTDSEKRVTLASRASDQTQSSLS